ncbi:MAG TPA: FkbM family methyltransferase [Xanthobacteraceae bacterium]|jgi:FkbM family methyltransferase
MATDFVLWEQWPIRLKRCRQGAMLYNINDTYIGRALDSYGEISRGEAELFGQLLRPSMTAVEIGANIGVHTIALARFVGPQGSVVAFEPQRIVFQMLCANLALNALTNVTAYQSAAGRAPDFLMVPRLDYAKPGNFGGVSLGSAEQGERVSVVTIDSLALPSCELLKIDVEGMERDVIEGAMNTIQKFRPRMYVENDRAEKSRALINRLLGLDYRLYWHLPPLFNCDNFFGEKENVLGNVVSINMLCIPRSGSLSLTVHGLREITSEDANWRLAG